MQSLIKFGLWRKTSANFNKADVTSTTLKKLVGSTKSNLERAKNLNGAFRD